MTKTWTIVTLFTLAACGAAPTKVEQTPEGPETTTPIEQNPTQPCLRPSLSEQSWNHTLTRLILEAGEPVHGIQDAIARPGAAFTVSGKFAYGSISKDLEDEDVTLFIETDAASCTWVQAGTASTDSDGRVSLSIDAGLLPQAGRYGMYFVVHGDQSQTPMGSIYVLERGTPTVVFDIDGTLTTEDIEVAGDVVMHTVGTTSERVFDLAGSPLSRTQWLFALDLILDEPDSWEGARVLVQAYVDAGYQPVFITGRPYLFESITRDYLNGFAPGPLYLAQDVLGGIPSRVTRTKVDVLQSLSRDHGLLIEAAYGNALTDACAYAEIGLQPDSTYLIGKHAGQGCAGFAASTGLQSYVDHLAELDLNPR